MKRESKIQLIIALVMLALAVFALYLNFPTVTPTYPSRLINGQQEYITLKNSGNMGTIA